MVWAVVFRECIVDSLDCEFCVSDAIGIASDECAKMGISFKIVLEVVKAEHDVIEFTVSVGYVKGFYDSAVG
ncbi:hypothetical protein ES707_17381 [subsurface metagenome]